MAPGTGVRGCSLPSPSPPSRPVPSRHRLYPRPHLLFRLPLPVSSRFRPPAPAGLPGQPMQPPGLTDAAPLRTKKEAKANHHPPPARNSSREPRVASGWGAAEGKAAPHHASKRKFKRRPAAVTWRGTHRGPEPLTAAPSARRRPWLLSHPRRGIYSAYLKTRCSPVPPPAPARQIKAAGGGGAGPASRSAPRGESCDGESAGTCGPGGGVGARRILPRGYPAPRVGRGGAHLAFAVETAARGPQGSRAPARPLPFRGGGLAPPP